MLNIIRKYIPAVLLLALIVTAVIMSKKYYKDKMFAHKSTVTVAEESSETEDEGAFALTEMQSFSFDMEDSKNLMNEITRNNEK